MKTKTQELKDLLLQKQQEMYDLAGDGKYASLDEKQTAQFKELDKEVNDLCAEYTRLKGMEVSLERAEAALREERTPVNELPKGKNDEMQKRMVKTLGEIFTESEQFKEIYERSGRKISRMNYIEIEVDQDHPAFKTVMTTAAGFAPANNRGNVIVNSAQNTPTIMDFIPMYTTSNTSEKFMAETTFTNNVGAVAETTAGGESAFVWTEQSVNIEAIRGYLPVSERQLESVSGIQQLINNRLQLQWELAAEAQVFGGNGTTPNLRGYYNATDLQTYAKGTDEGGENSPDAIFRGMDKIRTTGRAEPEAIFMHPTDWKNIRLLKNSNGDYIWGAPTEQGVARMWGLPVIVTTSATQGSPLIGAFRAYSAIAQRNKTTITVGLINDDFIKNKLTFRVQGDFGLLIYRGAAFCTVTGL